jgi:hypothetical protein
MSATAVRRTLCGTQCAILAFTLSLPASAQETEIAEIDIDRAIFSKSKFNDLCETVDDKKLVKRSHLGWQLIGENTAIKSHKDLLGALRIASSASGKPASDDENIYFFVSREKPFGSRPKYSSNADSKKKEMAIEERQKVITIGFAQWLEGVHKANDTFHLESPPGARPPTPAVFFADTRYRIVCTKSKQDPVAGGDPAAGKWLKKVVVRKSVADLSVGGNDLKKANGAQLSYTDDEQKKKRTVAIEGLVGYVIAGDSSPDRSRALTTRNGTPAGEGYYWYKVIPYLYYKNSTTQPASAKDVEYASPGVTSSLIWANKSGNFAVDFQVDLSGTFDTIHDSRVYNIVSRLSPTFNLDNVTLFGAPIYLMNDFFVIQPDVAAVAGLRVIEAAGNNPDLAGLESYNSFGYDFRLQAYFNTTNPFLSNLIGKYSHSYRSNTESVADIWRNTLGIGYVLNENTTIDFDYTSGRDLNTLQMEERWTAALTFRN